jgi:hypothetical protein
MPRLEVFRGRRVISAWLGMYGVGFQWSRRTPELAWSASRSGGCAALIVWRYSLTMLWPAASQAEPEGA